MGDGQEGDEKVALMVHTDDATFFVNDGAEMERLWRHMREYAAISGAAVNEDKSKVYLLPQGSREPTMATTTLQRVGTPQEAEDRADPESTFTSWASGSAWPQRPGGTIGVSGRTTHASSSSAGPPGGSTSSNTQGHEHILPADSQVFGQYLPATTRSCPQDRHGGVLLHPGHSPCSNGRQTASSGMENSF